MLASPQDCECSGTPVTAFNRRPSRACRNSPAAPQPTRVALSVSCQPAASAPCRPLPIHHLTDTVGSNSRPRVVRAQSPDREKRKNKRGGDPYGWASHDLSLQASDLKGTEMRSNDLGQAPKPGPLGNVWPTFLCWWPHLPSVYFFSARPKTLGSDQRNMLSPHAWIHYLLINVIQNQEQGI